MSVDWQAVRDEFPALQNWTFLNTATYGQMPLRAEAAAAKHFERRDALACADFLEWFDDMDRLRASIARLIHCSADDIAFIGNAGSALSVLLNGIVWQPGDQVLTLEHEFPNNLYAPSLLAARGVEFITTTPERLIESIGERTRLVALSSVNYTTGFRAPLDDISKRAHQHGALLYVDGTQSIGALCMDLNQIHIDMSAVHAYKWLLSPNGAAFMYVHPKLRARLDPNVVGWRSHREWRNVDNLHHGVPEFSDTAEKYEAGMLPFVALYPFQTVVDWMLEIGPAEIEQRVLSLAEQTRKLIGELGGECRSTDSQIVAAQFENVDASQLARTLQESRVLVSARHNHLRISPHLYNNEGDLEVLAGVLREALR